MDLFHSLNPRSVRTRRTQEVGLVDLLPHKIISTKLGISIGILVSSNDREQPEYVTGTVSQRRMCLSIPSKGLGGPRRDVLMAHLLALEEGTPPQPPRFFSLDLLASDIL